MNDLESRLFEVFEFLDYNDHCSRPVEYFIVRHGKFFIMKRWGYCFWTKIVFYWINKILFLGENGRREFYRLEKEEAEKEDRFTIRKEYFEGEKEREYVGQQNCFIEFFSFFEEDLIFPNQNRFIEAAEKLKLETSVAKKYIDFYTKFFLKIVV